MARTAVFTKNAPPPIPQLSQAIKHNGMVYCSGSLGIDHRTGKFVEGSFQDRVIRCLMNLKAVLEAAGSSLHDVVKVNVFLTDMKNFKEMNEVYDQFFTTDPKPARTCVAVHQLPLGADVEVECIAVESKGSEHSSVDEDEEVVPKAKL
ncbi:Endoribonuclease L-PSP/chorismate mutase-like protein [Apiosordaria backusii]|uniref:Endoribonuclease L-PSP/chorismate mutase-like protein n=1 Tax=Apiosordaria backusii TaxID=314023 RepID=A0AA40DZJ2_9PEZI|nr:Endoribonuclease L-PSP/chorismate mutase-like protein [Apiosordaria backusii]